MKKVCSEKVGNPVELLQIKTNRYLYEVQEQLDIYDVSIQVSNSQMETLLNDVMKVELEETEVTRGGIYVRKDGEGKYCSVKNIHLNLTDFLELGFNLLQIEIKYKLIVCTIFLIKLMEQLGVDLKEEQTAVCVALYKVAKRYAITDDNIIRYIAGELKESNYIELNEKEIWNILSELIEMGIVSVKAGRYEVTQELIFE